MFVMPPACPGHPRLSFFPSASKSVDGRDKPGRDDVASQGDQLFFTSEQTLFSSGRNASSAGMVATNL